MNSGSGREQYRIMGAYVSGTGWGGLALDGLVGHGKMMPVLIRIISKALIAFQKDDFGKV